MRGTKRAAVSDTFPATTKDTPFHHKKFVGGSLFGTQSVEPAQQHSPTTTTLDKPRAESARKHVRALNNQFASWVQMQLKNHPDELWEDGLRDYLAHASSILEKFSDVVDWLKANSRKGENLSSESHVTEKKLAAVKNNNVKLLPDKNSFVTNNSTTGAASASNSQAGLLSNNQSGIFSGIQSGMFSNSQPGVFSSSQFGLNANSQSGLFGSGQFGLTTSTQPSLFTSSQSGVVSNSQPPFSFSNNQTLVMSGVSPVSITAKRDGLDDADGEDEPPQPSSPSVKKAEENGIVVVHQVKCKLYVKSNDPEDKDAWKDKGTGNLCIKCKEGVDKGTRESKPTIIVRNDVGKLLLNALLYHGIKTNAQKNSLVAIFHTSDDDSNENVTPRTFLIRTKTAEDRDKLATAIGEYAPSS